MTVYAATREEVIKCEIERIERQIKSDKARLEYLKNQIRDYKSEDENS